jgi:hypothetical protein
VRKQQNLFNASVVLIEDKASGTQLIQELVAEGGHGVTRYQPTGDKTMRMHAQTAMIENGFVHIPETAPWLAEYLHELTVFPNGKHDDQADSTAQFLDWFKMPFPGQGIFELVWGFSCQVVVFGLLQFFVRSGKGRSSSRRLRSGSRSARKGSRDRNASTAWRLAA